MDTRKTKALILDGRQVASEVLKNIRVEINKIKKEHKRIPGLGVILAGDNEASRTYVKNKEKTCTELGIYSEVYRLPSSVKENELINLVNTLNNNNNIDGILIQLPLPIHINSENVINFLNPNKDIDGLHPYNLGKLISGKADLIPCTPQGIIEILKYYSITISGKTAVIIGRSILVGKPLSLLLLSHNSTVTTVHSKTQNIKEITKTADILISCTGKATLVTKDWVKNDAIVIDVGINKIQKNGVSKIVGDVDFENVVNICQAITPVPGGVGPVTIAMLMKNTLEAYKIRGERGEKRSGR